MTNNRIKLKTRENEAFYLIALFLYTVFRISYMTTFADSLPPVYRRVMKAAVLLFLMAAILARSAMSRSSVLGAVFLGAVFALSALLSGEQSILFLVAFVICSFYVRFEKIIPVYLTANILMFVLIMGLCYVGVLEDLTYPHVSVLTGEKEMGHALGFLHYSTPSFLIFFISIYLMYYKRSLLTYLLLAAVNVVSYILFTTRLVFFLFFLFEILLFLAEHTRLFQRIRGIRRKLLIASPALAFFLSFVLSKIYTPSNRFLFSLNDALSNRLGQGQIGLTTHGFSLFGSFFELIGVYSLQAGELNTEAYFYIDNDYLYMAMRFGILFAAIVLFLYAMIIRHLIDTKNHYLLCVTIVSLLFAFVNWNLVSIELNPLLLCGYGLLCQRNSGTQAVYVRT